ncbi:MAG: UDP-N-acetylmuramate dehydrogenase [Tannerella sp.]|nr:UDP-N-acetylmuramate dehydrogenase [Tannerella sp.]
MKIEPNYPLDNYNTFGLRAKARRFVEYDSEEDLHLIINNKYFPEIHLLHIGRGSNLLFLNDEEDFVLHSAIKGIRIVGETDESVLLRVGAAEIWDDVVAFAVGKGWGGIENLSLIPGETGAAAVQNIGAYGAEIKDAVETVEAISRFTAEKRIFTNAECCYNYRDSFFKRREGESYFVTYVTLHLAKHPRLNLKYNELGELMASQPSPTPAGVREAVIGLRRRKLPDPSELGNAGSFFVNPSVSTTHFERLRGEFPDMPFYPAKDGMVKLSAGWLIERCGLGGVRKGNVGTCAHRATVIVNYGGATGGEIATFAGQIRERVGRRFDVWLVPEVKYVGQPARLE